MSLLYGELLPIGLDKALDRDHLNALTCKTLLELGSGVGKAAVQIFLQYPQITYIYGCEIFHKRYESSVDAILKLQQLFPARLSVTQKDTNLIKIVDSGDDDERNIHDNGKESECFFDEKCEMMTGDRDLLDVKRELFIEEKSFLDIESSLVRRADIIILEIDLPECKYKEMLSLFEVMHDGARILTYLNLFDIWTKMCNENTIYETNTSDSDSAGKIQQFPWRQLEVNISLADRFATSWSPDRGHHFYLWIKIKT